MEELKRVALTKGLKAQGLRVRMEQLDALELPVIALVNPGHYIVIFSADQRRYRIVDPEKGERAVTIYHEVLERDWTG
jgi:ABC-type bacteriocin/lantibiotic exporter with double-glycine peptidase domain